MVTQLGVDIRQENHRIIGNGHGKDSLRVLISCPLYSPGDKKKTVLMKKLPFQPENSDLHRFLRGCKVFYGSQQRFFG